VEAKYTYKIFFSSPITQECYLTRLLFIKETVPAATLSITPHQSTYLKSQKYKILFPCSTLM